VLGGFLGHLLGRRFKRADSNGGQNSRPTGTISGRGRWDRATWKRRRKCASRSLVSVGLASLDPPCSSPFKSSFFAFLGRKPVASVRSTIVIVWTVVRRLQSAADV